MPNEAHHKDVEDGKDDQPGSVRVGETVKLVDDEQSEHDQRGGVGPEFASEQSDHQEDLYRAMTRLCGRNPSHAFLTGSRIGFCSNHCVTGLGEPDMLTGMTERDWSLVLEVFDAAQSSRGEPGHDDRKFLEALHYFTIHSITWRALPREFGKWNSVWKRFWRLSRSGVFEAFFQLLAECSQTAHLVQFFDSTTARAHVSAAGAKGGSIARRSAARAAVSRPKSTSRPISMATLSTST